MWYRYFISIGILLGVGLSIPRAAEAFRVVIEPLEVRLGQGETAVLTLAVDTEAETINLSDVYLAFQPELLSIVSIGRGSVAFPLWLMEPEVDRANGRIRLVAGIQAPGFSGAKGKLADITIRAIKPGATALESVPPSTAYLSDGRGTLRLLREPSSARITVLSPPPALPSPLPLMTKPPLRVAPPASQLFSITHPDPVRWYPQRQVALEWTPLERAQYSFVLDTASSTIPDTVAETREPLYAVSVPADGRWYFHLRVGRDGLWSATAHLRVQIDTTPPAPFKVSIIPPAPELQDQYALAFTTTDVTSGLSHFEVQEPSRVISVQTAPYILARQASGIFRVKVTAVDQAGNRQERTFFVRIPFPRLLVLFWVVTVLLLIIAALYLFLIIRRLMQPPPRQAHLTA